MLKTFFRYLNPEANTAGHTNHIPAGADPTHFYHHSEDHQQEFLTPPPYRTLPYGASPSNHVHGYYQFDNGNMSSILESVNNTLASIQKQLTTLEEKHTETEVALGEIQNQIKEVKVPHKSTSRKSPPGLSVCIHINFAMCVS